MQRQKSQVELNDLKQFIEIEDENRTRNNEESVKQQPSVANVVAGPKKFPRKFKLPKDEPCNDPYFSNQ